MRRTVALPLLLLAASSFAQTTDPLDRYVYPLSKRLNTPKVVVDTSDIPSLAPWGEKAKQVVERWYPYLTEILDTRGYKPPKRIKLTFKKTLNVPAYESGGEITINGEWVTAHPDDMGMVVHELTHVVQAYPDSDKSPGWLVEGIADYTRWWRYEPESPRTRVDPAKNKYTDAYRITAAFLAWVTAKYNRGIVFALDSKMRKSEDPLPEFTRLTGKDVDALWAEFIATIK